MTFSYAVTGFKFFSPVGVRQLSGFESGEEVGTELPGEELQPDLIACTHSVHPDRVSVEVHIRPYTFTK